MSYSSRSFGFWFLLFFFAFASTAITWWFIERGAALYHFDMGKMLLSCSIAGAKWAVQFIAAFLFLGDKKWPFIQRIALTCFAGSCVLLPFCLGMPQLVMGVNTFLASLVLSVCTMLVLYYRSVVLSGVSIRWYFLWLACLATAITLQLTVVF